MFKKLKNGWGGPKPTPAPELPPRAAVFVAHDTHITVMPGKNARYFEISFPDESNGGPAKPHFCVTTDPDAIARIDGMKPGQAFTLTRSQQWGGEDGFIVRGVETAQPEAHANGQTRVAEKAPVVG